MGNPCHVGAHVLMKEMHNKWTNIQIQVNVRGFEEWQGIVKRQNVTGRECLFGECHPQEALAEKVTVAQKNEQSEGASHRNPQWRVFQRRELTKALRKHLAVPWTLACSGSSEEAKMARVAGTTETLAGSEVREGRGNHTGSAQCAKEFEFHSKWYGKILTGCEQKNTVFFFFYVKKYLSTAIHLLLSLPSCGTFSLSLGLMRRSRGCSRSRPHLQTEGNGTLIVHSLFQRATERSFRIPSRKKCLWFLKGNRAGKNRPCAVWSLSDVLFLP